MKINTIQVTAGRTFNHPHEQYSNLRPEVTMTATLEDGEDAAKATRELQAKAEQIVEDHKRGLLTSTMAALKRAAKPKTVGEYLDATYAP